MEKHITLEGEDREKKPEEIVLEDVVIPFLREDLGYTLIDPRLQKIPVKFGRQTKFADTVVYIVKKAKKIPHIVVESKAPGESLDFWQAESYAQRLGSPYFLVTDGNYWHWYQTGKRQGESKRIDFAPPPPPTKEKYLVKFEDFNELSKIVGQCHDEIRNAEGLDPTISFDEITKILFAKMQDEIEVEQGSKDNIDKTPKVDYEFKVEKNELPEEVVNRVTELFERAKGKYPEIFVGTTEDIKHLKLRPSTLHRIVPILEGYNLRETPIDVKGGTYEAVIKGTFMGRGLGQFFTPREVVEFMVDMVRPLRRHYILDPACGSGGFLIVAMDRVYKSIDSLFKQRGLDNPTEEKQRFSDEHLFGIDLNERMAWVAKMNMVMHGDGHDGIFNHDGLRDTERIGKLLDVVNTNGGFDIILTNPPFGSKIKNKDLLVDYELGKDRKSQLTEVLFTERCLKLLKPRTGKMGIVLPDGILTNSSLRYVREFIKNKAIIKAVISLPNETFMPYGSGVKASLLFLQRKDLNGEPNQGPVFMATAENVGYDATGRRTGKNDLHPIILDEYHRFEEKHYCE